MVKMHDMVAVAVNQMQDSGVFGHKILCDWEQKPEHDKTWETMKTHYTNEYDAIKNYDRLTTKSFKAMRTIFKSRDCRRSRSSLTNYAGMQLWGESKFSRCQRHSWGHLQP